MLAASTKTPERLHWTISKRTIYLKWTLQNTQHFSSSWVQNNLLPWLCKLFRVLQQYWYQNQRETFLPKMKKWDEQPQFCLSKKKGIFHNHTEIVPQQTLHLTPLQHFLLLNSFLLHKEFVNSVSTSCYLPDKITTGKEREKKFISISHAHIFTSFLGHCNSCKVSGKHCEV